MTLDIFGNARVHVEFDPTLARSQTSDRTFSRNDVLSAEFEGTVFTTDTHPQYRAEHDTRRSTGTHAELVVGLDWVRAFRVVMREQLDPPFRRPEERAYSLEPCADDGPQIGRFQETRCAVSSRHCLYDRHSPSIWCSAEPGRTQKS
jgi:hypothetical protein